MSLANKSFKNNRTGEIVKVIDSFENIAILENKQKIEVTKLLDISQFTEEVDVKSFFETQSSYNLLASKIKNIPMEHVKDDTSGESEVKIRSTMDMPKTDESAIIVSDPDQEKAELAKKYSNSGINVDSIKRQNDAFAKILGDEADELPEIPAANNYNVVVDNQPSVMFNKEYVSDNPVNESNLDIPLHQQFNSPTDPIISMFKNVKRSVDFKISIDMNNKIPRLDFLEMMEDSYEVSIIDFLADEFTKNILKDPSSIKELIKAKLKQLVYGGNINKKNDVVESKIVVKDNTEKKVVVRKPARSDKKNTTEKKSTSKVGKLEKNQVSEK